MSSQPTQAGSALEVFRTALKLGLSSFGGPVAHLGYFERVYVRERRWLDAGTYASLVALCQILPGPASSQTGFLIGLHRAGWMGALAAWLGFTLPSAVLMAVAALLAPQTPGRWAAAIGQGLQLAAVAVVAQAVWSMATRLRRGWIRALIALGAAGLMVLAGSAAMQLVALAVGAAVGILLCRDAAADTAVPTLGIDPRLAWLSLGLFASLLVLMPLLATEAPHGALALGAAVYRSGALVFGGGHVVLPLLRDALVPGWIGDERFLAGYGLAQALPGPLFAFAAYLGAAAAPAGAAAGWAAFALVMMFLPGLLLAVAGAALWDRFAAQRGMLAALAGINAAVIGILAAALYDPVWTTAVRGPADAAIALAGLGLLQGLRLPPLAAVLACVVLRLGLEVV